MSYNGRVSPHMVCPERERLLEQYRVAVDHYATAVQALRQLEGERFLARYWEVDEARERCDRMRRAIDEHRRQHGC